MGHAAYEARRAAEQAEAERAEAGAKLAKAAIESVLAFLSGDAHLAIMPPLGGGSNGTPWCVRFVRDR